MVQGGPNLCQMSSNHENGRGHSLLRRRTGGGGGCRFEEKKEKVIDSGEKTPHFLNSLC